MAISRPPLTSYTSQKPQLDPSGKGTINTGELQSTLVKKGVTMTDYEFMLFLAQVDVNVDG